MQITIRGYESRDLPAMVAIWNEVVEDGIAFPQEELLTEESGREFFAGQSWCGVAEDEAGKVLGFTFCTLTMWGAAGTFVTRATR